MHETSMASGRRRSEAVVMMTVFTTTHGGRGQLEFPLDTFRQCLNSAGFGLHIDADASFRPIDQSTPQHTSPHKITIHREQRPFGFHSTVTQHFRYVRSRAGCQGNMTT